MTKLQRYELTVHNSLKESDTGPWWQHAADRIEALERENTTLRAALERIASVETFTTPFMRKDNSEGLELVARIDFAASAIRNIGGEG